VTWNPGTAAISGFVLPRELQTGKPGPGKARLFGFVFQLRNERAIYLTPSVNLVYAQLSSRQIGFVFSQQPPPINLVSDFEIQISGFRPQAGLLASFFGSSG